MRIERNEFARALSAARKVVESRNTIPILSCVKLVAADGMLNVTATDLDIESTITVAADGDIAVCVEAGMLDDIVKRLPAGQEISLDVKDNTLAVVSGRSRFKLSVLPVPDFPTLQAGKLGEEFTIDLAAFFAPVKFAISTEETRYYLNGIYMHHAGDDLIAVATDGHRLSRNRKTLATPVFAGVIVPRKMVGIVPSGEIQVALSTTKIRVTSAATGVTMTSKLIDGTFPDYDRIIPTGNDKIATVDNATMKAAVERISTVSSERGRSAKLSIAADSITLFARGEAEASDEIPATFDNEPLEIGFGTSYLIDILSNLAPGPVEIALFDAGSPALIKSAANPDLLTLLMPMRV